MMMMMMMMIIIIKGFNPTLAVANALTLIGWFEQAVILCGGAKA